MTRNVGPLDRIIRGGGAAAALIGAVATGIGSPLGIALVAVGRRARGGTPVTGRGR